MSNPTKEKYSTVPILITSAVVAVVLIIFALNYEEWFLFKAHRDRINNEMKDPQSTQWRNEKLSSTGHLCGEFNSKNSYGAYAGFRRYISKDAGYAIEGEGDGGGLRSIIADGKLSIEYLEEEIEALRKENAGERNAVFNSRWRRFCT